MPILVPALAAATLLAALTPIPGRANDRLLEPRRDPFAPYTAPARCSSQGPFGCATLDELNVLGVVTGTAATRALMKHTKSNAAATVRVGDWLGTARVVAIRRDGVVVERTFHDSLGNRTVTKTLLELGGGRLDV